MECDVGVANATTPATSHAALAILTLEMEEPGVPLSVGDPGTPLLL